MGEAEFHQIMAEIEAALIQAGYDPYAQLTGYLKTGQDTYITHSGGAREKIKRLDRVWLQRYIENGPKR